MCCRRSADVYRVYAMRNGTTKTDQTPERCYCRVNYRRRIAHTKKKSINFTFYKDTTLLASAAVLYYQ